MIINRIFSARQQGRALILFKYIFILIFFSINIFCIFSYDYKAVDNLKKNSRIIPV